jgi:Acetyltransferase (GNAT) family
MQAPLSIPWVKLELDVRDFDSLRFVPRVHRCAQDGIRFETLSELGDTVRNHAALYELNRECAADIPDRGEFLSFDEYIADRIDVSTYNPDGILIALAEDRWIGMSAISDCREKGYVFNHMTGVRRSHRRKGIALVMKVINVDFVRSCGVDFARTVHQPRNAPMIALNRVLGYVDASWDFP